ncbi:MAG TPA: SRPBCC family protein [Actinomycetota bacterium]|nr:SRPBCC family protein [Actinomycetota bacterium]
MTVIENSVHIDRTPEDVFDYLVDLRNELEWNPDAVSVEKTTEGPLGAGTRYLAKWKQSGLVEVECTRYDRPKSWSHVNGGSLAVALDATVTPQDGGSLLQVRFDARPNGMLKLFFPVLVRLLRRSERRTMKNIKVALEGPSRR